MDDAKTQSGGCLCGAVRYTAHGAPLLQCLCHCRNCQKQAGTAWSMVLGFPKDAVETSGEVTTYCDRGDSGEAVRRQFCGTCGSPVFTRADGAPEILFIKAGTLDDPGGFAPQVQYYTRSRQAWLDTHGCLPTIAGFATMTD